MNEIISKWYDVRDFLPGHGNWCVVRCINIDSSDFYFLAYYFSEEDRWEFFDEEYHTCEPKDRMQVTHWSLGIKLEGEEHKFILKDKNEP